MSWKLDNIELKDYGVRVHKSTGVLDMPVAYNQPTDWLDEQGDDFWQDVSDIKYKDREISLQCWIKATGYAAFKTAVAAFYAAIQAPGTRELKYNDTVIATVSVQDEIPMQRKSSYVQSLQIGVFTLKLTVHGDTDYYSLNIKRYYTYNTIATVLTRDLKVYKTLQGDMYATFSFESNQKLDISFFDEIDINTNGTDLERYYIETEPEFKKVSTNKYVYQVKAHHMSNWLSHSQFLNDKGEGDFYYFANMSEVVDLIISNHQRKYPGGGKFLKGTIATTERRNHKFSAESCQEVLRRLCSEYELEFEFDLDNPSLWQYYINIAVQVANDRAITVQYGKGNGLYELTREAMDRSELCTVLHAFGSTKNLKPGYRNGLTRLSFDTNPLEQNYGFDYPAGDWGVAEKTVFFEDIYPRREASVTAYLQKLPGTLTDAEKAVWPGGIYKITDSTLDFNINDYLLGGLTAKVHMNTGDLAGYEFEIAKYDDTNKDIYIIPFKDERGELFPNASLQIAIGDGYVLLDIDQPASYVAAAEAELAAAAADYLADHSTPKFTYRSVLDPGFLQANPTGYEIGDRITIIDTDYNVNGLFRIAELVYDAYKKSYEFKLSDKASISKRRQLEQKVAAIERSLQDTGMDQVESMRKGQETTGELRNRLLDPTDDYLNVDRIMRRESIDPRMLAYDASTLQFSIQGGLIETNVDGNEDKVKVEAGSIILHNYNALSRYEINQLKEASQTYDPTRVWVIPETTFTLPTKDAYWIYAKLNLTTGSTECTIQYSTQHLEIKSTTGYLIYKLASISAGEE